MSLASIIALIGITAIEERELRARFGQVYADYQSRVPMLWPRAKDWVLFWEK